MTPEEVKAAAPAGADLYCRGDGDAAFDETSGLPQSTTQRYCTWSTGNASTGKRIRAQVQIGSDTSSEQTFVFDQSGSALQSFSIVFPNNAYDRVVKILTDKLGSPDAEGLLAVPVFGGAHWDVKGDRLTASIETNREYMTDLLLMAKPKQPG